MPKKLFLEFEVTMKRTNLFAVVSLAILLSCITDSEAAAGKKCYELAPRSTGKQSAVCQELEKNLNEFCDEPPMVCSLKISSKYPKLSLPEWTPMDFEANMGLVERLQQGSSLNAERRSPGSNDRNWEYLKSRFSKYGVRGEARLARTSIDPLNRGEKEIVYLVDTGSCRILNFGGASSDSDVVQWRKSLEGRPMNQRYSKTDPRLFLARHADILENPAWRAKASKGQQAFPGKSFLGGTGDLFLYEGRVFQFHWDIYPWVEEATTVNASKPEETIGSSTTCQFKYFGSSNKSEKK